jgi:hypothetical protein
MKKFLTLAMVLGVFLSGCVAANEAVNTSSAVQVPDALKVAINGLVLFGVTFGLQLVFDKLGLDLRGLGVGLAVAVSEFAILQLQGLIDIVPAAYDIYVTVGLNVILAILTSLGFVRLTLNRERAQQLLK